MTNINEDLTLVHHATEWNNSAQTIQKYWQSSPARHATIGKYNTPKMRGDACPWRGRHGEGNIHFAFYGLAMVSADFNNGAYMIRKLWKAKKLMTTTNEEEERCEYCNSTDFVCWECDECFYCEGTGDRDDNHIHTCEKCMDCEFRPCQRDRWAWRETHKVDGIPEFRCDDCQEELEEEEACTCCGTTCLDHTSNKGRGSEDPCSDCGENRCKHCPCECDQ
tara:strand:+ start:607 stop:1269 length:663 start_codon:yes stop_codon:yes gene_type:complete